MGKIIGAIGLLVSVQCFADPQINAEQQMVHWIFDPVNTAYEHERGQNVGVTRLDDGTVNGYTRDEFLVPVKVLPAILQAEGNRIDICGPSTEESSGVISLSECELFDTGGTQYKTGNWWMNIRVIKIEHGFATLKTGMECFNGIEQN